MCKEVPHPSGKEKRTEKKKPRRDLTPCPLKVGATKGFSTGKPDSQRGNKKKSLKQRNKGSKTMKRRTTEMLGEKRKKKKRKRKTAKRDI